MADQANSDLKASQTGIDPITGSILSPETRKLLFKRSQMSSSSFLGGGRGSGIVPVNRGGPDPQTLAIVKAEETSIATLRQQINALVKRDDNFLAQVAQVSSIQQAQINGLSQTVIGLGAEFEAVRVSIINDSLLEQQKARQENEYEKQLAEQGLRQGKEKLLEQRIQNALMSPVRAIGNKVSGIFGNLMNFMWQLLGGWITIQGLNVLKALATGDKKKLEEIKNNVIKGLLVVGGSLLFVQFALGKLVGSVAKLALKASKFVLENTIGKLFGFLLDIGKGALGKAGELAKPALKAGGELFKGFELFSWVPKIGDGIKALGTILKGGGELAGKVLSKFVPIATIGSAIFRFSHGDPPGGILSILESIPFVDIPAFIVDMLRDFGAFQGTPLGTSESKPQTQAIPTGSTSAPSQTPAKSTPQSSAVPTKSSSKPATSTPSSTVSTGNNPSSTKKDQPKPANLSSTSAADSEQPLDKKSAQTQKLPTTTADLGQPTEPSAKVVMVNSPQAQSSSPQLGPIDSSPATDIPLFPSANPDNFYSLYAQVNYNVIL